MKKEFWIFINLVFILFVLIKHNCLAVEEFGFTEKKELIKGSGGDMSQYSPWVMHENGWGSYLMYYCKMTPINGIWQDRVHRIENWSNGIAGGWVNDIVVVQGELNEEDDLSCSPGVLIDKRNAGNEIWRMYYIVGRRDGRAGDLYIHHATSEPPGINWQKKGRINIQGLDWPITNYAAETPVVFVINNKIVLYFPGSAGKLDRMESDDGDNFYNHEIINLPDSNAGAGRVFLENGIFYYVYGRNSKNERYSPTDQIYVTKSTDGVNFEEPKLLMQSNGEGWDGDRMWSPQLLKIADEWRVYYAGNIGDYGWFGANTSIGVRSYEDLEKIFETECQSGNGDYNENGKVDIADLVGWYSAYRAEYDIKADFDCKNGVDIGDLMVWYEAYRQ